MKKSRSNHRSRRRFENVRTAIRKRSKTLDVTPKELEEYLKPARGADSPNG